MISTARFLSFLSVLQFILLAGSGRAEINFETLVEEMADLDALAAFPEPGYESLQASSYNRLSTARDQADQGTGGWFADSDGVGFIRTEEIDGRTEWVVMEHTGPGALTRFWTPFFYYGFGNRVGPNIRIYLDGSNTPVIDENFIELLTKLEWGPEYGNKPAAQNTISIPSPFAGFTARAGVLHLPIPFATSCKVTMSAKPFYNVINYRAYPAGTDVRTFTPADLESPVLAQVGAQLASPADFAGGTLLENDAPVPADSEVELALPPGPRAVRHLEIELDAAAVEADPAILRRLVLAASFDGEETVWCPVGDFFSSSNRLNNLATLSRHVTAAEGRLVCRWVMPYEAGGSVRLLNLGDSAIAATLKVRAEARPWDENSLHFHANWRADDVVPGTPFLDWNFIDIQGKGVFVGDSWTVLNLTTGWWGEGDEKIYVDDEYEIDKFPSQFGTGTEDYYGWAGGVVPTREDEFSNPYEANVQVGSRQSDSTQGFNISTRTRTLDAIPFSQRLVFDMEASAGTGQRNAWNLLMYSVATYWYARPGATSNRPPLPSQAARPITSFEEMHAQSDLLRNGGVLYVTGAIEAEDLTASPVSAGLVPVAETPPAGDNPQTTLSGGRHLVLPFTADGQFAEFRLTEQFIRQEVRVRLSTAADYGHVDVMVNGETVATGINLASDSLGVKDLDLGEFDPVDSAFNIRIVCAGAGAGGGRSAAVDAIVVTDPRREGIRVTTDFDFTNDDWRNVFDTIPYGNGPAANVGALTFDGTTAVQAATSTVYGGAAPADNYGFEVIVRPSALEGFDIAAGVVDEGGSNSGAFLFQQGGAYRLIESSEGAVSGTMVPTIDTTVALAFVMDGGTARLLVNGVEEAARPFSPGGATPIDTATLEAFVLGGNLFDNGAAPGGGAALGAFNGTIHRFRAFVFDPGGFDARLLLGPDDDTNDFTSWIDNYPVRDQSGFGHDPDGDGLANGIENVLGTHPGEWDQGLYSIAATAAGMVTFQHSRNSSPASDLSPRYQWSSDMVEWNESGDSRGGATVTILPNNDDPVPGMTTVTATASQSVPSSLFLRLVVEQQSLSGGMAKTALPPNLKASPEGPATLSDQFHRRSFPPPRNSTRRSGELCAVSTQTGRY